jgi:hypothetical protein
MVTQLRHAAQTQLVRTDGQVDRGALKYLQQALGSQAVPIAAQTYQDPRLTDPAAREPLARLALSFVGVDAGANEFYEKTINDNSLTKNHRRNLIEDLNEDGFTDPKNVSERELPLIQNRLALIGNSHPRRWIRSTLPPLGRPTRTCCKCAMASCGKRIRLGRLLATSRDALKSLPRHRAMVASPG